MSESRSGLQIKEQVSRPQILVRQTTPLEDMRLIIGQVKLLPWYREHNYRVNMPDLIAAGIRYTPLLNQFSESVTSRQENQSEIPQAVQCLQNSLPQIEKAVGRMIPFQQKWGFQMNQIYPVLVSCYIGGGGNFDLKERKVYLPPSIIREQEPGDIVIHEIAHLGLNNLAYGFGLTQKEIEALVTVFCNTVGKDIFQPRPLSGVKIDANLFNYLSRFDNFDDLPTLLKDYIQEHPRKK